MYMYMCNMIDYYHFKWIFEHPFSPKKPWAAKELGNEFRMCGFPPSLGSFRISPGKKVTSSQTIILTRRDFGHIHVWDSDG